MAARSTRALGRRFRIDVNTGTEATPVWTQVKGLNDFTYKNEPKIETSSEYEDEGAEGAQKVGYKWSLELVVERVLSSAGAYDPGQEAIRLRDLKVGAEALVHVRWYERQGGTGTEAYEGYAIPQWEMDGTGDTDIAAAKVTFTGDGLVVPITNPVGAT